MNAFIKLSALATAAALISISAQAQTAPATRADVQAELTRAQAAGELDRGQSEIGGPALRTVNTYKTRAEVQAELARARANGEMDFAYAEVNGGQLPQRGSVSASDLRLADKKSAK
ncbi:DUF4148 domain-containing protein [uncultured Methylibium sp.]|uniref:DUF4148 domain-containing protein n=1 Tax=uncultured Methylibium sp. TaxID=381093 RepID=UPI0025FE56E8|nr:DUF4148 domain-containing protein [uncultured Methylibium sp.]